MQQVKFEPESTASTTDKGNSNNIWVNSRRRKSSRPQWHYEGTVLDKSCQRLTVNGTTDDSLTAWEDHQSRGDIQGRGQGQTDNDNNDDDSPSEDNAVFNCVS